MEIKVVVLGVMTPCSEVLGYHRFGVSFCLRLHHDLNYYTDRNFGLSTS